MDLLEQYKQQNPEAFQKQKPPAMADAYGREYSGMIAFVLRLSGGRIRDARRAGYVLLVLAVGAVAVTFFLFAKNFNVFPPRQMTTEEAARQREEYKKIQPF